jgi:hypothetical protein
MPTHQEFNGAIVLETLSLGAFKVLRLNNSSVCAIPLDNPDDARQRRYLLPDDGRLGFLRDVAASLEGGNK